jgi:hypothetical protein
MCGGVRQVCIHQPQTLEDDSFSKRALRSSELLGAQTSNRNPLHKTDLIGLVQNLRVCQKVTFPNCIDLLRDFSP